MVAPVTVRFFTQADLAEYRAAGDPLLALLGDERAEGLTGERWLMESEAKRMIAWAVYKPLLTSTGLLILDVGAGFSSLSFLLAERHDYLVADLCAHDSAPPVPCFIGDWGDLPDCKKDRNVVISSDLFPNVDQRLSTFLCRHGASELRLALTVYEDRWYQTRRIDGDEILTMQAWDWSQTQRVLQRHIWLDRIGPPPTESLFPNGRQVCLVTT